MIISFIEGKKLNTGCATFGINNCNQKWYLDLICVRYLEISLSDQCFFCRIVSIKSHCKVLNHVPLKAVPQHLNWIYGRTLTRPLRALIVCVFFLAIHRWTCSRAVDQCLAAFNPIALKLKITDWQQLILPQNFLVERKFMIQSCMASRSFPSFLEFPPCMLKLFSQLHIAGKVLSKWCLDYRGLPVIKPDCFLSNWTQCWLWCGSLE